MNPTDIEGWMREKELIWLSKEAKKCKLIVEVGTWCGRSTYAMALKVRRKIITIDSFLMKGVPYKRWDIARIASTHLKDDPDWLYNKCLENLAEFIKTGKVIVLRGESSEVIRKLDHLKGHVDMVFIDGSHDYESVKQDIINYKPLVKKGGILAGHDFGYQVQQAVEELLPGYKIARNTSIWTWGNNDQNNH